MNNPMSELGAERDFYYGLEWFAKFIRRNEGTLLVSAWREARKKYLEVEHQTNPYIVLSQSIAERNYAPEELKEYAEEWDKHHQEDLNDAMLKENNSLMKLSLYYGIYF